MTETKQFGKGALQSETDVRDYKFAPRGAFDWSKGFDIEKIIGQPLVVKDQNGSGSCGGQAWATYGEVLEAIATGNYEPRSARWIYSHTHVPSSGSAGRVNCDFVIKNGFALETDATSYENGKPPSEAFMRRIPRLSKKGVEVAQVSRALSYLNVGLSIEAVAQAIQTHNGVILAVTGQDNGTWRSAFPKPPTKGEWNHWVYAGKVKTIKGKKYIGVLNSWGKRTGENGWQWLGEDYFKSGYIYESWTLAWDYKPAKIVVLLKEALHLTQKLFTKLSTKK